MALFFREPSYRVLLSYLQFNSNNFWSFPNNFKTMIHKTKRNNSCTCLACAGFQRTAIAHLYGPP